MEVLVTGVGVASRSLPGPAQLLQTESPSPDSAETPFEPAAELGGRGFRFKDRATQLALLAATRALSSAGLLTSTAPNCDRTVAPGAVVGTVTSSNLGNLDTVCHTADVIANSSASAVSALALPNASSNIVASSIAVRFGLRGPNLTVCNGASSGLDAAHLAAVLIAGGRVPVVLVIGVEPVNDVICQLTGEASSVLFDGAAAVVLESAAFATRRGAPSWATLRSSIRRADVAASLSEALAHCPPPRLWLVSGSATAPDPVREADRRDLESSLGKASGALGVVQIAAAAQWLVEGRPGPVLATAGAEDGVTSVLLRQPAGAA